MDEKIIKKLNSSAYDFLRDDLKLKNNIIYLVVSGSYGYGTNGENSDIDLRGFLIEDEEVLFKLGSFEQYEDRTSDTVIYGLKKYINLALSANPHALELLGIEDECIYMMNSYGKMIRDNSNLFLSKRVINSFGNYALAQLRRLENALSNNSLDLVVKNKHLLNALNKQLISFNQMYHTFDSGNINLYINESPKKDIYMDICLSKYPLRDFTAIYSNMNNIVKSYEKLNHRNNKKEEVKLYKHAMHLVRLLITGRYILEGNGIKTRLENYIPLFLDIRNEKYNFDQIFEIVNSCEKDFNYAAKETNLPDIPNKEQVEDMMEFIYKGFYNIK
ncbi:nucleotidyltransferase domain-containing protein [Clostridium sp. C8-1-8]|uniref:DNA polymerase beta superfamily protein n=1 Tax=Clostridium sp. C8-1-8 TaxID=2698831 RepID=UPI00136A745E|nr:nucleotidyltransferase domain-containing protein [Clostridium sp. C8-1-8]